VRAVLDTNVIVSGALSQDGVCARVLERVRDGRVQPVYSTDIVIEYLRVLRYTRLGISLMDIDAILDLIEKQGLLVEPVVLAPLKDPTDTKFLEAAVAAGARYLVTGNLKDFPAGSFQGVKILAPAEFLKLGF